MDAASAWHFCGMALKTRGKVARRGFFITFEGSEGCGKTTQLQRLARRLTRAGSAVLTVREPGGTALGDRIRHLLKFSRANHRMSAEAELLLFAASRAQLVREKILPALARGRIVLCDRFADSTRVYQGIGRGLDRSLIRRLNRFVTDGRQPDLTFVLDLPARRGLRRARTKTRRPDRMESQRASFYEAVRRGFRALARSEPRRVRLVDGSGTLHQVSQAIWKHLQPLLRGKGHDPD